MTTSLQTSAYLVVRCQIESRALRYGPDPIVHEGKQTDTYIFGFSMPLSAKPTAEIILDTIMADVQTRSRASPRAGEDLSLQEALKISPEEMKSNSPQIIPLRSFIADFTSRNGPRRASRPERPSQLARMAQNDNLRHDLPLLLHGKRQRLQLHRRDPSFAEILQD